MANDFIGQDSQPIQLTDEEQQIVKEAVARQQNLLEINSAEELQRFKQRLSWRGRRTKILWTAAASLIFIIGVGVGVMYSSLNPFSQQEILVYEANDSVSEVMLYTGSLTVDLAADSANSVISSLGALLAEDGIMYDGNAAVEQNLLVVPNGKTFSVTLSDGTTVFLNSHSRLTYPSAFTGDERRVELSGEAYFKVAKDAAHPFIVESDGVETKVLGTEFNVRNFGSEPSNVTLVEGSVLVRMPKHSPVRLLPGQNIEIQENGRINVENVDVREYTEWKSGFFYFDNRTLTDVFRIVGRYYNVSVMCQESKLMGTHFNLWIDMNKSLEDNLDLINEVGDLHSKLVGKTVIIQ